MTRKSSPRSPRKGGARRAFDSDASVFVKGRSGVHSRRRKASRIGYTPLSKNKPTGSSKRAQVFKKYAKRVVITLSLTFLFCVLFGILFVIGLVSAYSKDLPNLDEYLQAEQSDGRETIIVDRNNKELYRIRGDKIKQRVRIEEVPDKLKWAFLVIEDDNFYNHKGLDYIRLTSAIICHARQGAECGGASTITQQVIKNTTDNRELNLERKVREAILSMQIEDQMSKDEILEFYLNLVPQGGILHGVQAGSQYLFGKEDLDDLTLAEISLLAAIPNQPDVLSKWGYAYNKDKSIGRASFILDRLLEFKDKTGVTEEEIAKAKEELPNVKYRKNTVDIKAPHFVNYVLKELDKIYEDEATETAQGHKYLQDKGYTVVTSVNLEMQDTIQSIIKTQVKDPVFQRDVGGQNAAAVMMDPKNGQILAMIGSRDFDEQPTEDGKFDPEVNAATSDRSMGSTMKPILYLAAFMQGHNPRTMLPDMPIDMRSEGSTQPYIPKNYTRTYNNRLISINDALKFSLNAPAVAAYHLVGGESFADTYVKLNGWEPMKDRMYPSAPLGAANIPLLEQTHAYNTLASMGVYYPKVSILQIKDENGKVIKDFTKEVSGKQVIEKKYIYMITELNKRYYLFDQNETLQMLQRDVTDIAGKTGTSDNSAEAPGDASFIAYTPTFTLGLWTGNSCGADKCPLTGQHASGEHLFFNMYEPILKKMLEKNWIKKARFEKPEGVVTVSVCPKTGNASSEFCSGVQTIAADTSLPAEEDMYQVAMVTECGGEFKLARKEDIELDLAKEKQYYFYKFPHQGIQDQVNKFIGGEVPPQEECTLKRDVEKPNVIILTPSNNSSYQNDKTMNIRVSADGSYKIKKVEFALNNVIQATSTSAPYSASIPLSSFSPGNYTLTVTATDEKGYTGSSSIEITINEDEPEEPIVTPTITIMSPTESQNLNIGSNVMLRTSFSNITSSEIMGSFFNVYNGSTLVSSCNTINVGTNSFTCVWTVPVGMENGITYTLESGILKDGQTYSDNISFTVN